MKNKDNNSQKNTLPSLTPEQIKTNIKPDLGDIVIDDKIYRPIEVVNSKVCPHCQSKKLWKTGVQDIKKCLQCCAYFGTNFNLEITGKAKRSFILTAISLLRFGFNPSAKTHSNNDDFDFDNCTLTES